MLKNIVISIFAIFLAIALYFVCCPKKPISFVEIQDKYFLRDILKDKSSKGGDKNCRWDYGRVQEYHLFVLFCVDNAEDHGSFYTIEKRYKIKKKFLKVDDEYIMFGEKIKIEVNKKENDALLLPVDSVMIHWDE